MNKYFVYVVAQGVYCAPRGVWSRRHIIEATSPRAAAQKAELLQRRITGPGMQLLASFVDDEFARNVASYSFRGSKLLPNP